MDEDELLFLAKKIPAALSRRVMERLDAFRKFAVLDEEAMSRVLRVIDGD